MKKIVQYLVIFIVICSFASCKEEEKDNHEERWMITNIEAINKIRANPEYKGLQSPGNEGSIYYKALKSGEGTDTIRYTSIVSCYYKGWFVADYEHRNIKAGDLFEQKLIDDGPPGYFTFNDVSSISGYKTALQHMVKGDKWEIWMPYQLAYGRTGTTNMEGKTVVPPYSTLVFEIEVVDVFKVDD